MLKRLFDILVALSGIIIFSPLIGIIALWIKLDSAGPVYYKSVRVGRLGNHFKLFKFRTMITNADKLGASSTSDDDPRITRIGEILRRYKLDELPQLINILKGEMSFVGPRPQVPWIVELDHENYQTVLTVRPGIADYAFVILPSEGEVLRNSEDPDGDYLKLLHPEKMRLSKEYVQAQSFGFDMKVLIDTAMLSFFKLPLFFSKQKVMSLKELVEGAKME